MTNPAPRILAVVAAVALGVSMLGCGVISQFKHAAGNLTAVSEVADKLKNSEKLTFTAEYKLEDGSTAKVVQQPPAAAYIGKEGRFIVTADSYYICSDKSGKTSCEKSKNTSGSGVDANSAGMIPAVAGAGFVSAPVVVLVLVAASIQPGANVEKTTKKVAGENSTCLKVTGIKTDASQTLQDFTACVTDNGLLASFEGTLTDGKKAKIELVRYSSTADASAFQPPAGAEIIDVDQLSTPN
jgi:outer membrane lipoprotein-sorting protein